MENAYKRVREFIRRMPKNGIILFAVIFIVVGYAFFFVSPYIFSEPIENLLYTELDTEMDIYDGHNMTIEDWRYSESQSRMEIIISFNNTTIDGVNKYDYAAVSRDKSKNKTYLTVDKLYESADFVVLLLDDIPKNYYEIAVSVSFTDSGITPENVEPEVHTMNIYSNVGKMNKVESITQENVIDLYIDKLNRKADGYKAEIKEYEDSNEEYNKMMVNVTNKAGELRSNEIYMTASEIADAESEIESLQRSYEEYQEKIEDNNENIRNIQAQVDEITSKIEELKNFDIKNIK